MPYPLPVTFRNLMSVCMLYFYPVTCPNCRGSCNHPFSSSDSKIRSKRYGNIFDSFILQRSRMYFDFNGVMISVLLVLCVYCWPARKRTEASQSACKHCQYFGISFCGILNKARYLSLLDFSTQKEMGGRNSTPWSSQASESEYKKLYCLLIMSVRTSGFSIVSGIKV